MFNSLFRKIISQQILSNIQQKYKKYIIWYFSNQKKFYQYMRYDFDQSDRQMYDRLIQTYQTDKQTAITGMLVWKMLTLKSEYYVVIDIVGQNTYQDGTLNIVFLLYNLKTGNTQQSIYQVVGQSKAIYYSMLESKKSLDYIYIMQLKVEVNGYYEISKSINSNKQIIM